MSKKPVVVTTKSGSTMELDLYLRVVALTAADAKAFFGTEQEPVDLGPPRRNGTRWKEEARVWGFPSREETAEEKAHRIWAVARGEEVLL